VRRFGGGPDPLGSGPTHLDVISDVDRV